MRIVALTFSNHMFANVLLRELVKARKQEVVAVIDSGVLIPRKSAASAFRFMIKKCGLRYFFWKALEGASFRLASAASFVFGTSRKFYPYWLRKYHIPHLNVKDINSQRSLALLKKLNPDAIVVFNFNQILKKEAIGTAKYCINLHPAPLPRYGGVAPHFWMLLNGEKETAMTIHLISEQIDSGGIILQEKVPISRQETATGLLIKTGIIGAPLLLRALALAEKNQIKPIRQDASKATYFSWPAKKDVNNFLKKAKFARLSELFRAV